MSPYNDSNTTNDADELITARSQDFKVDNKHQLIVLHDILTELKQLNILVSRILDDNIEDEIFERND